MLALYAGARLSCPGGTAHGAPVGKRVRHDQRPRQSRPHSPADRLFVGRVRSSGRRRRFAAAYRVHVIRSQQSAGGSQEPACESQESACESQESAGKEKDPSAGLYECRNWLGHARRGRGRWWRGWRDGRKGGRLVEAQLAQSVCREREATGEGWEGWEGEAGAFIVCGLPGFRDLGFG